MSGSLPVGPQVAGGPPARPDAAARQAAVTALGVRALGGLSFDAVREESVALVAGLLDTEFVKIVELLPDGSGARLVAGRGWRPGVVGAATVGVGRESQAGVALQARAPVVVDDLSTEPRLHDAPLLREHGVVSGISVILYGPGGASYGVLGAHTARRRTFGPDDVSFVQGVANVLSAACQRDAAEREHRRLYEEAQAYGAQLQDQAVELEHQTAELEQQMEEAHALAEELAVTNDQLEVAADRAQRLLAVAAGLSAAATPADVADVIFREGLVALRADAGSLALVHPADASGGPTFEMIRTTGYSEALEARYRRFPLRAGRPLSDAVLSRTPCLLGSWAEWRAAYPDADTDVGAMGYEAFAAIPIVVGGRVLAAFSASFRQPITFDDDTRTFLATLGQQCGLALERARAFEAEHRASEASAFLAEASRLLGSSLEYETTLRTVAESAVPRLGDWCAVDVVRDPTASTWPPVLDRVAVVHQDPEKVALAAVMAERYPTDWSDPAGMSAVLREGASLFLASIPDAMLVAGARDAEHLALLRSLRFSSLIAVPLIARGRTLGALTLCHTESGRRYDAADLALAENLAQRAAIAVDNARLFRDAELARQTAEEANRGKSAFLATMSHELRTPLNAIAGHVQLLELEIHGPVTDAQRDALSRVGRAQQHLLGLITDVLNYARIESGRLEYDVQPLRVAEVLQVVVPMVEPQFDAKGLAFEIVLPAEDGDVPPLVWADRDKLSQILLNLLSNAVKFTPATRDGARGRVRIELREDHRDPTGARSDWPSDAEHLYLLVSDTGVGIPADKAESIFEPFVQVRSELTRAAGGTGLGLAISRDLARGMGGDLCVQSVEDVGSTFTLALRRVATPAGDAVDRRTGEERRLEEERRGEARRAEEREQA